MQFYKQINAVSAKERYEQFKKSGAVYSSRIEKMNGVEGYDAYNPSVPFNSMGKTYIAARVEKRDSEMSEVKFFEKKGDEWFVVDGATRLQLQDPCVTYINGELILGGVSVEFPAVKGGDVHWHMDFYKGKDIFTLEKFAEGPSQMKDIRLTQLPDGMVGVFSRPQGRVMERYGCISKIGFTVIDGVNKLNASVIDYAPYLEKLFLDDEWGGANQAIYLGGDILGVVGHKACRTYAEDRTQRLHYYGMAFELNYKTRELTDDRIIISRDSFPSAPAKRFDLGDITFTSGLITNGDGKATVYTGLSDAYIGSAVINDPFVL